MKKILLLLLAVVTSSGCASFDAEKVRLSQVDAFTNHLAVLRGAYLSRPLSLQDAIDIAMTNNYEVRKADLDCELARLGKKVAFGSFIPNVSLKAGYNSYQKEPQVSSKNFETVDLEVGMPIFMPSTWFLYAAARHGFAAGDISAHYARQNITLQTVENYCSILVTWDLAAAYEAQLRAAEENYERIKGLADEGLVVKWESAQAAYLVASRRVQVNRTRRQLDLLRAKFLAGLGLGPDSAVRLSGDLTMREANGGISEDAGVDTLTLKALQSHPLLSLADRQVVMKELAVRQAICDFIPTLSIFGKKSWSGNEVMTVSPNWISGFSATWNLLNGFVSTAQSKMAKIELKKSELERENTFLSIIVSVTASEAAWRDAREALSINERAYDVACARYADYDAKSREGLLPLGDALDARAQMDLAEVELVKSRYMEITARAALRFAMGDIAY